MCNSSSERLHDVETIKISEIKEFQSFFAKATSPYVVKGAIEKWPSREWTIDSLGEVLQQEIVFRVHPITNGERNDQVMETDCAFVSATLKQFHSWLQCDGSLLTKDNPFHPFERTRYWCYADYKYMKELFETNLLEDVIWNDIGLLDRNGKESTLWIGSDHANTPCHMDTYGVNFVAQIQGKKQWTLFSPEQSYELGPTRIPFEESSIFCDLDMKNPPKGLQVTLEPGDVLYVPKHWWHYVECLEPSISINTWVEEATDRMDRLKESLTRLLVCSLKELDSQSPSDWLNPTEENYGFQTNISLVKAAAEECLKVDSMLNESEVDDNSLELTNNELINILVSKDILDEISRKIVLALSSK